MTSANTLKSVRQVHNFVGLFFAPTIFFFAITGALQMFGLHESSRGSSYVPPAILVHLSQLHKKGTLYLPPRRPPQPPAAKPDAMKPDAPKLLTPNAASPKAPPPRTEGDKTPRTIQSSAPNPLPIKIFFAATATALVISTLTGIIMGWKYARRKSSVAVVLAAGVLLPLLLLLL